VKDTSTIPIAIVTVYGQRRILLIFEKNKINDLKEQPADFCPAIIAAKKRVDKNMHTCFLFPAGAVSLKKIIILLICIIAFILFTKLLRGIKFEPFIRLDFLNH
jgi:hypothetical protein